MKPINSILVARLCKLYDWPHGRYNASYAVGITVEKIFQRPAKPKYISKGTVVTLSWDLGRVRYFYEELLAGRMFDPITIYFLRDFWHRPLSPSVGDGHHRLTAAYLAEVPRIPAIYKGADNAILQYLRGDLETCPRAPRDCALSP